MRRAGLLLLLVLAPAAARARTAPPSAPVADGVEGQALDLLRAIRAESLKPAADTAGLRQRLAALQGRTATDTAGERMSRAAGYIALLEAGQPLPPPLPDEAEAGAPADESAGAARRAASDEADGPRPAHAALLAALSGPAAGGVFDGGGHKHRGGAAVEVEPTTGHHTVNIDKWLSASGDTADDDRRAAVKKAVAALLAKAGVADPDGKRAKALAAMIHDHLKSHSQLSRMTALRLRVTPDGRLILIYRTVNDAVVEEDLAVNVNDDKKSAKGPKLKARKKPKKPKKGGGDKEAKAGKHGKSGGKGGKGGGGGGGGGSGEGGAGAGKVGKGGKGGRGSGGADVADDVADGAAAREGAAALRKTSRVDPDGFAGKAGKRAGAPKGGAAASGRGDAGSAARVAAGSDDAPARGGKRKGDKGEGGGGKGAKGDLADALPGVPKLTGDRPKGDKPGKAAKTAAGAAAAGAAAPLAGALSAPGEFAAGTGPAAAPAAALADDFAGDGPLRDAVAAGPAVPAPRAAPRADDAKRDDSDAPFDAAAAPAMLLLGSASLGGLGLLVGRLG
jgi:hypothetical protein